MGLPSRFMELSSRMYPRPAPQLPLWIPRHNTRGGFLVSRSHGDGRCQDNSGGVPLCLRFLASAANNSANPPSVSSARRQQYFPAVVSGGCHNHHRPPSSSATKDGMLSARARGRRWFSGADAFTGMPDELKQAEQPSLLLYRNLLKTALLEKTAPQKNRMMLDALVKLKAFVKDCKRPSDARELLSELLSPLECGLGGGGGGLDLDDAVVKESLEVARLLMDTVSKQVRVCLCNEQQPKRILKGIITGRGGRHRSKEVIELAREILAKLSPATP